MEVSVIIVNYNTSHLTNACIDSVIKYTSNLNYEIILVDNASSDGSQELFRSRKDIIFIESNVNLGFGRGNNLGVNNAKGNFLFFLNSDTLIIENSIFHLYEFFKRNEDQLKIGALGCKLVDAELKIMNSGGGFPKVVNDLKEYYYVALQKIFKATLAARDPYDFSKPFFEIDYVIGADLMMRKSIYDSLGGFDEQFFMYYEESDLQFRLWEKGLKCYITTETQIIHLEGGSTNSESPSNFKRITNQVSRNYYFKKNDSKMYFLYVVSDFLLNFTRIFNKNYTTRENFDFVYKNIKSY